MKATPVVKRVVFVLVMKIGVMIDIHLFAWMSSGNNVPRPLYATTPFSCFSPFSL